MNTVEDKNDLLKTPLHGLYIPVALVLVGVSIMDYHLLPYTVAILAVFLTGQFLYARSKKFVLSADKFQKYELLDKTIISRNSAIYRFALKNEDSRLNIPVGQHLACKVRVADDELIRYYTPISNQFDEGFFDILVKSYKDGKVSKKFASLTPGQFVEFKGPVGRISYQPNIAEEIIMIAGGSGITPMLQVIGAIITTPEDRTKVKLIYANETENDILLKDELDEFSGKYPGFDVEYVLNDPPEKWNAYIGHITKELLEKLLPAPSPKRKIFICGPMEMKKNLLKYTEELGWERGTLKSNGTDQVFCF
ncbi:unnamed protein product [Ambrosiozyma monospora]|uniref:NADH-cytochrome b5 reductase n=1 Tax=Ambrosiozyma monospora TaxID=43982 RepID=A0A9W6YZH4_AMBMO|nr:unnamed protein product [Ambrosiozyma monospora]